MISTLVRPSVLTGRKNPEGRRWWLIFGVIILVMALMGCADKRRERASRFFQDWREMARQSRAHSPESDTHPIRVGDDDPPARSPEVEPSDFDDDRSSPKEKPPPAVDAEAPEVTESIRGQLPTDRISLQMHDVSLPVLIRTLARAADQNILISRNVKGQASLSIQDAPWDRVFHGILKTYGLTYSWEGGNILRIISIEDIEYELRMKDASQRAQAAARENELKRLDEAHRKAVKQREIEWAEPLLTRVMPIKYANPKTLKDNLDQVLIKDNEVRRGSVAVDSHTQSLILQGTRGDLKEMIALLQTLDRPMKQVLIEAHIVEAEKNTAWQLGAQWGGLMKLQDNTWLTSGAAVRDTWGQEPGTMLPPTAGPMAGFGVDQLEVNGLKIGYVAQDASNFILAMQLSALENDGKVNILSSPSITTLDNQTALIESGKEVPYQTVEDNEVNIEFKRAVLSLKVTPHVIDGKTLKLDIETKKDELDFSSSSSVQGNPTITTKRAETSVILFNGETAVIGGLSKESSNQNRQGIPYLKDIPLLGYLFKSRQTMENMEEVLIFITPHILQPKTQEADSADGQAAESLGKSRNGHGP